MKAYYNPSKNQIRFSFQSRVDTFDDLDAVYDKASDIREFRSSSLNYLLSKNPNAVQIIFTLGYNKSTVNKYLKRGVKLPEDNFTSIIVPKAVQKTPAKLLKFVADLMEAEADLYNDPDNESVFNSESGGNLNEDVLNIKSVIIRTLFK